MAEPTDDLTEASQDAAGQEHGSDPFAENAVEFELEGDDGGEPEGEAAALVARARRRHGAAGGILAAGMFGLDQALTGRKKKEEAPIVVSSNSDPVDIDKNGIVIDVDDGVQVVAPPQPRAGDANAATAAPLTRRRNKHRRPD